MSCTVQYIFGCGFSLAAPLDALLAAAVYAVYQQHLLEVILDCGFMLFRWFFSCLSLCLIFACGLCHVVVSVWKLGCWLFDGVFSSAAGTPVSRSARNVSEPFSLAACISLGMAAKADAVRADPPVVPSRPVTKRLSSLALDPPAFFVKPVPVSPTGVPSLGISCAGRAVLYAADRWVNCAAAVGRRVSFSGALPLSGLSSAAIDPGHPTTSAISSCRRVGGVRRCTTAFACSLRARGNCRVGKSGRRSSGVSLRRNLARAFKAADILGISSGISLLSSFRGAAANACQLLRVTSCAKKVNTGLFLASAPTVTPATGKRNASSAARHVPRFPAAGGRVNKPVVAGATARRMRRAGVEDALRLHQSHSAATVSASRAAVTAAATSL